MPKYAARAAAPSGANSLFVAAHPPRGIPKTFLSAWLLLLIGEREQHGYELAKALRASFAPLTDAGSVYRSLRRLEHEGLIVSSWSRQESAQPRRSYQLTLEGAAQLRRWRDTLGDYHSAIEGFLARYEQLDSLPR
jgi:DNA-binding PadR family transcriptional regulator